MAKAITKRAIISAVEAALKAGKGLDSAKSAELKAGKSLADTCRDAFKTPTGKKALVDALWHYADDTEAKAGNPFHKLRQTLNTRCRISVHTDYDDDGYIAGFTIGKMKGTKPNGVKPVDPDKAYDALVKWVEGKAKRNPEWAKALLSFNANAIRKAVNDGARDAGVK